MAKSRRETSKSSRRETPAKTSPETQPNEKQATLFALEEKGGKIIKKAVPQNAYRLVGDEVLGEKLDPECWAKALATGVKTRDEALGIYAKLRADDLAEKVTVKETKAMALEERRLVAGASDSESHSRAGWQRGFSLVWDFLFWQVLLSVSGVGLFLTLLAMGSDSRWWPGLLPLVVVSAGLQLLPIFCYGAGKWLFGRMSYTKALGVTAVALISVGALIGIQTLIGKKSPRWLEVALDRAVEAEAVFEEAQILDEEF